MIRRLGGRRWQALHRLMYVSCIAAIFHYWWLVKADVRRPVAYGLVIATLLTFRLYWARVHGKHAALPSYSAGPRSHTVQDKIKETSQVGDGSVRSKA